MLTVFHNCKYNIINVQVGFGENCSSLYYVLMTGKIEKETERAWVQINLSGNSYYLIRMKRAYCSHHVTFCKS